MPELPEVEVVKQSLEKYILNKHLIKIVVKNNKLRFPVPKNISKKLSNLKTIKVNRISKYVVIEFENNLQANENTQELINALVSWNKAHQNEIDLLKMVERAKKEVIVAEELVEILQ